MGCPSTVILNDDLVFSICTYNPITGEATPADAPPAYKVYSGMIGSPIITGVMAALDAGSPALYFGRMVCTSGSGFAESETYTIFVTAAVATLPIGASYAFMVRTKTGYATTQADQQASADEFLNRNLAGGGSGGPRIVRDALRMLRNFRRIVAGVLTVYQEDDNTAAWSAVVTTTPGNPTNSIDPT